MIATWSAPCFINDALHPRSGQQLCVLLEGSVPGPHSQVLLGHCVSRCHTWAWAAARGVVVMQDGMLEAGAVRHESCCTK